MPAVQLTQEAVAFVDEEDAGRVSAFRWVLVRAGSKLYAARSRGDGSNEFMHRFLMKAPDLSEVDHKDGDGLNNRRGNMRLATRLENTRNSGKRREARCTSPFKGVKARPQDRSWQGCITVHGKMIHLGCYTSEHDAARAYDAAAVRYFGEFARLNFPAAPTLALEDATSVRRPRIKLRGCFHGVTPYRDGVRWMAAVYTRERPKRRTHLGLFDTAEAAARAYDDAARTLRPDAPLNF